MSSLADWYHVPAFQVQAHWHLALPFVQRALAYQSDHDENSVYRNLVIGDMQLWLVHEPGAVKAAVVTRFLQYPLRKVCLIFGLGGDDMEQWIDLLPAVLEPWAKAQGCTHIELRGRAGWERMLGWHREAIVLRKEL